MQRQQGAAGGQRRCWAAARPLWLRSAALPGSPRLEPHEGCGAVVGDDFVLGVSQVHQGHNLRKLGGRWLVAHTSTATMCCGPGQRLLLLACSATDSRRATSRRPPSRGMRRSSRAAPAPSPAARPSRGGACPCTAAAVAGGAVGMGPAHQAAAGDRRASSTQQQLQRAWGPPARSHPCQSSGSGTGPAKCCGSGLRQRTHGAGLTMRPLAACVVVTSARAAGCSSMPGGGGSTGPGRTR